MSQSVLVYRLEHRSSGLGPFEHRSSRQKSPDQSVLRYLYTDERKFMPYVTEDPSVKQLFKINPKLVFGWNSEDLCLKMIKNTERVHALGFRVKCFSTEPIRVFSCGQVIFDKSKALLVDI
jgi:hypothetical protein